MMSNFAAIGTDGTRLVVWGLGSSERDALSDAHQQEEAPEELEVCVCTDAAAEEIKAGGTQLEDASSDLEVRARQSWEKRKVCLRSE